MAFFMFFILFQLLFSISLSYFTGPNPLTWSDGQTYCQSLQTTLASIHSDSDFRSARSLCVAVNDVAVVSEAYGCWIGLMFSKHGILTNVDGTTSDYGFTQSNARTPTPNTGIKPWPPAHPNSNRSKRDCVQLSAVKNYYYDEDVCNVTKYPLCNDKPVISSNIMQSDNALNMLLRGRMSSIYGVGNNFIGAMVLMAATFCVIAIKSHVKSDELMQELDDSIHSKQEIQNGIVENKSVEENIETVSNKTPSLSDVKTQKKYIAPHLRCTIHNNTECTDNKNGGMRTRQRGKNRKKKNQRRGGGVCKPGLAENDYKLWPRGSKYRK